jgi:hypothetical protein
LKGKNTMTSFVHTDYPREHPGVARAEAAIDAVADMGRNFDSAKTLATLLSAAVVAALVVVADRLIDTWADGHLLATWVVMWAVAFAALGFFAPMAKQGARSLLEAYDGWAERSKNAHAEEAFWQSALNDPRVMAEYQAAKLRSEQAEINRAAQPEQAVAITQVDLGATLERVTAELAPSKRHLRYA